MCTQLLSLWNIIPRLRNQPSLCHCQSPKLKVYDFVHLSVQFLISKTLPLSRPQCQSARLYFWLKYIITFRVSITRISVRHVLDETALVVNLTLSAFWQWYDRLQGNAPFRHTPCTTDLWLDKLLEWSWGSAHTFHRCPSSVLTTIDHLTCLYAVVSHDHESCFDRENHHHETGAGGYSDATGAVEDHYRFHGSLAVVITTVIETTAIGVAIVLKTRPTIHRAMWSLILAYPENAHA